MVQPKTPGATRGTIEGASSLNVVTFTIRAAPLPEPIFEFLRSNLTVLKRLQSEHTVADRPQAEDVSEVEQAAATGDIIYVPTVRTDNFWEALTELCKELGPEWINVVDSIWAFGPQGAGECILIDARKDGAANSCVFCNVSGRSNELMWLWPLSLD